ncbi:PRC-barrel domain-containing protein [Candidatus Pacearchaeota archaeon]|nr:PRC-barrel domain-containing protein [Candidatus Pacearchaeota archaeon]
MIEVLYDKSAPLEKTFNAHRLLGSKVLSPEGLVVGRVKEIRISPDDMDVEGIIVSRGWFKNTIYIGKNYFKKLSQESLILSIEPTILIEGREVINFEGKRLGKITRIERADTTNAIRQIVIKRMFHQEVVIPGKFIQGIGKSVILKESYDKPEAVQRT